MNDERNWAIAYFASRAGAPWRWADDGKVLAWADGTTIAFREEIILILEWLVPQGWPAFGTLVRLLAACRGKLPPPGTLQPELNWEALLARESPVPGEQTNFDDWFARQRTFGAEVEAGLAAIARLPAEVRASPKAKAVLAEVVFGGGEPRSGTPDLLRRLLEVLRSGVLTDAMLNDPSAPPPDRCEDWLALHDGLCRLAPETLALRLRTGLEAVPEAAPLDLPPATRMRAVLDALRADAEHRGLAGLTRDVMAALQLPRELAERDDLPLGGFSDLANRGNLDRLLLSELAHDDFTLAVRIALNEALYLRREPPAKQPPSTLAVLLDSGVRLWGVPRVFATSVALALGARCADHERHTVFRASGGRIVPIDLSSKAGVIDHLAALESHAQPGAALAAFRAVLREEEHSDAVLITQREVAADPDFQRDLALAQFDALYLAVVDRDGSFELRRHPASGPPLCRATLDLEQLFPAPATPTPRLPLMDRHPSVDLPLILSTKPFPLLLSVSGKVQRAIAVKGGGICVTQDRRLLKWEERWLGARMVAAGLPKGATICLEEDQDGTLCVVKMANDRRRLSCRFFVGDGTLLHSHDWNFSAPVDRVERHGGLLFIFHRADIEVRELYRGQVLCQEPIPRGLRCGRYLRDRQGNWSVLAWTGQRLEWAPVTLPELLAPGEVLALFDREGFEGPWAFERNGSVWSHEGLVVTRGLPARSIHRISPDGHRLITDLVHSDAWQLIDLKEGKASPLKTPDEADLSVPAPGLPILPMRKHFSEIGVSEDGALCLRSRGSWWQLELLQHHWNSREPSLNLTGKGAPPEGFKFQRVPVLAHFGCALKEACWPDGRRAWLDERGLLHLRCAGQGNPEVTIVLTDWPLAAWSSDGRWHGSRFFIGDHPESSAEEMWTRIQAFTRPT
ncbi:MAG: hypothetical protein QOE70_1737 [Chthoniobacter sp.]|jgi:hypothetical protein|nr:hypothetical protein [Chthoniobacter sp.]